MKIKLLAFLVFTLMVGLFLVSCNKQADELATLKIETKDPNVIGKFEGLNVYESAEFLADLEDPSTIEFPVLVETPESAYQMPEDVWDGVEVRPRALTYGIRIDNPFETTAATGSATWTAPDHHKPWGGTWATDLWKSTNGQLNYAQTCDRNIMVNAQIYDIGGTHYDQLKGRVLESRVACSSGQASDGGYMQKIELFGKRSNVWHSLGWVIYAHLKQSTLVYGVGNEFTIATYPYRGSVYLGKVTNEFNANNSCSKSCHLHTEVKPSGWGNYHVTANNPNIAWNSAIWSFYKSH